jgi:hypothetical protein
MGLSYTPTPFHPTTVYPDQVTIELNLANQNFTTLAQAFVNNDPTTLTVKNAVSVGGYPVSSNPAPNTIIPLDENGKFPSSVIPTIDNTSTSINATTVGGYGVSPIPTPNMLLPLDSNGKFPASVFPASLSPASSSPTGYANPVNLTGASSDYLLQVGEVAYISFNNQSLIPLHIAIPEPSSALNPVIYEITLSVATGSGSNGAFWLYPNNTSYGNISYSTVEVSPAGSVSSWSGPTNGGFGIDLQYGQSDTPPITLRAIASYWGWSYYKQVVGFGGDNGGLGVGSSIWFDTSTWWTSLGTLQIFYTGGNATGVVLIRRLA